MENMTEKERDLLIRDLSCRVPYHVAVVPENPKIPIGILRSIDKDGRCYVFSDETPLDVSEIKPLLKSIPKMTKKERKEIIYNIFQDSDKLEIMLPSGEISGVDPNIMPSFNVNTAAGYIEELYKRYYDIHDLLEMDLAIEANRENSPYQFYPEDDPEIIITPKVFILPRKP